MIFKLRFLFLEILMGNIVIFKVLNLCEILVCYTATQLLPNKELFHLLEIHVNLCKAQIMVCARYEDLSMDIGPNTKSWKVFTP